MTKQEFHRLCAQHDWTYEFSDDHQVWKRGRLQRDVLLSEMRADNELCQIYNRWATWINSPSGASQPLPPEM